MKKISDIFDYTPRVPLFDNSLKHNSVNATCGTPERNCKKDDSHISRDMEDMLIKAKRKPYLTMTELYKELSLSGYKGFKYKQGLIREGLAFEVILPTNRRGRKKKLLQVTPKGNQYLKDLGITVVKKGRGGVKHLYYQRKLKDWYEAHDYTVEVEATIGNTSFDVLVIGKDGSRIGLEIALSEQYEKINAEKALKVGIERLIFVCETKALMERLRRSIGAMAENLPGVKPGFKLVNDYIKKE